MNKTSSAVVRTLLLGTSCLTVLSLSAAKADPTGGTVVTGSATIASHGNSTTINQSTNRALINWDSFSIAAGGQVRFNQPGTGSITLNRVVGSAPSSIYGSILANGQVWLINSNGILFGKGAQVNVGGLLATTSNISDGDFASGNFNFSGGTGASVVNQGTIHARNGGSVVLSGSSVDNQGLIQADAGTVVLGGASAFTVDFDGDNLLRYAIAAPAGKADNGQTGVSNSGTIQANNGGRVIMTARAAADIAGAVINNTGIVTATSAKVQNGEVVLDGGDGDVNVSGTITATGNGNGQSGGFVDVSGRNITVADNTHIDVSGANGGGSVHIGGDLHGAGPLPNAANVTVGSATIKADATRKGNGGTLVVWSNGLTDFSGIFSAIGGAAGGDGGFIETSGHHLKVGDGAKVDTTAARGNTGTWLLDPDYIVIESGGETAIDDNGAVTAGTDPGQVDYIAPSTITSALATSNVRLEAVQNITVYDDVIYNSSHALSLLAEHDIYIAANVQNDGSGAINLVAGWDGETIDPAHFTDHDVYGNNGGSVFITSDDDLDPGDESESYYESFEVHPVSIGSAGGTTTIAGFNVSVLGYYDSAQIGYHGAGGGDIVVRAAGDVVLDSSYGYDAFIGNGSLGDDVDGNITGNIDVRAAGALTLSGTEGVDPWIGNVASGDSTASGNLTLIANNESGANILPMLGADVANGDVFYALTGDSLEIDTALEYNSAHTLSLLANGIIVQASVLNNGMGDINLIAGWDGHTTDLAHLTDTGVFANSGSNIYIQNGSAADVSVGSAGGKTTVAAANFVLRGENGHTAQLGYNGAGGGDIFVETTGGAGIQYDDGAAFLGNGSISAPISGDISGDIKLDIGGQLTVGTSGGPIYLGNYATSGHDASGNLTVLAGSVYEPSGSSFEDSIGHALAGGDVTIGVRAYDLAVNGAIDYSSSHTLNLLAVYAVQVNAAVTNGGSGNINIVAGWDTATLNPGAFTTTGVYGGNGALLSLNAAVSSATGVLTLASHNIQQSVALSAPTLNAYATGDITLTDPGNTVATASVHAGGYVVFFDNADLTLKDSAAGGLLYVGAAGDIVVDGQLQSSGTEGCGGDACIELDAYGSITETENGSLEGESLYASSDVGDVTLDNALNAIDGEVRLYADDGSVTFIDSSGFTMEDGNSDGTFSIQSLNGGITIDNEVGAGGAMTIQAHDDIVQTDNSELLGGDLTVTSSNGGIDLFDGYNDFTGTVSLNAQNDVRFYNDDSTVLGASNVGGQLYVDSFGDVTQNAAIVAGSLAVETDGFSCDGECVGASVTLTDTGNSISGDVAFDVQGDVNFTDSVGFNLGRVVFGHSTDHTYVGGDLTATALSGGITINGGIETGLNGTFDPTLTADGDITETADGYILGGDLNVTSTHGRISLLGDNDLTGTVSLNASGDALFFNDDDVNLGASSSGGTMFIGANGNVTQSGALTAVNLVVNALASECGCSEGDVTLDNAANAISGNVAFEADGDVVFKNSVGFTLADVAIDDLDETYSNSTGGDLTATALTGGITIDGGVQTGLGADPTLTAAGDVVETENGYIAGGDLHVTSTGGKLALSNANNALTGTVSLSAPGNASFANRVDTTLGVTNVLGNLTVLSEGDIYVTRSIQNAGSGDITLIAGWDGITTDPLHLTQFGVYGNGGDVEFGNASEDVAVGSAHGVTTIAGHDIELSPTAGYEQIGYHGAGGGNIVVRATGDLILNGSQGFDALIGNGSRSGDVTGNVGGDIDIRVEFGATHLVDGGEDGARAWIGNATGGDGKAHGNVTLVTDFGGVPTDMIAADLGTSADTGGDFFFGYTDANDGAVGFGGLTYNSPHDFTLAAPADLVINGFIQNAGSGAVTLVAGWDEETFGAAADLRAAHAYGLNNGSLIVGNGDDTAVGSAGGVTTVLTDHLVISPTSGFAQLGYHGAGGGDIVVVADGDLTMDGGADPHDYAMIGNGSLNGDVAGEITGNIDIHVGATTTMTETPDGAPAWIGNVAADGNSAAGDVKLVTGDFDGPSTMSSMIAADLAGGDFTFGISDPDATTGIDKTLAYNSGHTLNLLAAGSFDIKASIQNGGSGAINIVAGWDGVTLDPAHFFDLGHYANHSGAVHIGGELADDNVAVGSFGGATAIGGSSIVLTGVNGYAQVGYHGLTGGAINLYATGAVTLTGIADSPAWAMIGNGQVFGSSDGGGNVTVDASTIQGGEHSAVTGSNLVLTTSGGDIGSSDAALQFASHTLQVSTLGGSVFLTSPDSGVTFAGTGVNTGGGSFSLDAGGAIDQTAAIHTGQAHIATTLGDITLLDSDNGFGGLTVATPGNASLAHVSLLTVAGADIGGKLTLRAGGSVNQSGAIVAAALDVAAGVVSAGQTGLQFHQPGGSIVLTNSGNSFGTLTVHTSNGNDANVTDSSAVVVAGATVDGTFTLLAGGAIGQSGAIAANVLNVSTTSGAVALNDAGNAFNTLNASTHGTDAAAFTDSTAVTISGAAVGGTLTLTANGAIGQTGAIHAGGLNVTTATGAITLNNAGNAFATLAALTHGSDNASFTDSTGVSFLGTTVGGTLTLAAGGAVGQTGAVHAASLNVSTGSGAIALNNTSNSFSTLTATTHGSDDASFADSTVVSIGHSVVGGTLTVAAGGAIGQTGAIQAGGLNVSTVTGGIVLNNTGNAFGTLTVLTHGSDGANFFDTTGVSVAGATVGGTFLLNANGPIGQTGAIHAATLTVTTSNGGIALNNAANAFATLNVLTHGSDNASFADATGLTVATANVGGSLTLNTGGALGQSGAITAASLNVSTLSGAIALNNSGNAFATLSAATHGADDASIADSTGVSVLSANVGGTLTLAANGPIGQSGAIHAGGLNVSTAAGAIALNNAGNAFGTLSVLTHGTDGASFNDSTGLTVASANVGGGFTLAANGAVGQSGAIHSASFNVSTLTGAIALTNSGNAFGALTVATQGGDDASFANAPDLSVASANVGGMLTLSSAGAIGQTGTIHAAGLDVSTVSGAIALTNTGNSFDTLTVTTHGSDNASFNDGTGLTIASAHVGGALTVSAAGSVSQSGAIVAASLDVTAGAAAPGESGQQNLPPGGSIALSNAGNTFGTLTVHTFNGNDATIVDSSAVVLAGAVVGGKFSLTAGGAITQTGAILAGQSSISTTSGDITLTNSANAFGPLTIVTPGNAAFTQSALMTVAGANVGGVLTLNAGSIGQSGAIVAASLSATASVGGIVLGNAGNSFGTLSVHTIGPNDATVTDSTAVVVASSAVGGKFTLTAGGTVSQSGAIAATQLAVTTAAGNIALGNTANAVTGTVQFATPGTATFYDTTGMNIGASTVGGDLTLLSKGNVNFRGSVQSTSGNITVVAGWDGVTIAPASFGNSGVFGNNTGPNTGNIVIGGTGATGAVSVGSKSGSTSLYANNLSVIGVNGTAQLGYHGAGGGAILVRTLHDVTLGANVFSAMIGNGSLTSDVTGNQTGDIDLRTGGNLVFSGTAQTWLGNVAHSGTETGNLIVVTTDIDDSSDHRFSDYITADLSGGDVTIGFTGSNDQGPGNAVAYNSAHTLNILSVGNFVIAGSIQNAGTGAINLVAGWDGHTLAAASYGTAGVYGNNGKGVLIGGTNASGNAAFGSAGGTTSIYAASLALNAVHGYAQLGFNGHGAGAIVVNTTGGVSLNGGAGDGQFAQIGNGGRGTSGNNSGDITIHAGGDLVLTAGAGSEAYAQLGHGGAESNSGANGYSNVAPITVSAANVLLNAGAGNAAYVQIGNGGYKSGLNLAGGTAVNGGAITIISGHAVTLTGNGADAYAQIGNGGSQSNTNAAAAAGGTDSGDIAVHAPNGAAGSVTLTSGAGANAYSQIGNGGYGVNSGPSATVANWTITGNVTVTDLALTGGTPGLNAYSLIGNGDASHNSTANVSGNIVIDANGQITYTPGTNPHSQATIGNFTGKGSVSGTLTGATPPPDLLADPGVIGVVVNNTAGNDSPTEHNNGVTTIQTLVVQELAGSGNSAVTLEHGTPGPLASLDQNSSDNESSHASDGATVVIADSLDGARKAGAATILQGMLKAGLTNGNAVHAVPPADQDFSSWGNEALWQ